MSEKPLRFVQIDDLARHVQTTLSRSETPIPPSLIAQLGGLIGHCLRMNMAGKDAYPGLKKMAKMGRCSERQARRNLRQLEAWLVMSPTSFRRGGRWATRYWFDLVALKRVLVILECNPSQAVLEKISALRADMRADICPDICPDMMSAGILSSVPAEVPSDE